MRAERTGECVNTRRISNIPGAPKGTCRHCRKPVSGRRISWCSDECVTAALIRKGDPNTVRSAVLKRDGGICVGCGLDCEQALRVLRTLTEWREVRRYGVTVKSELNERMALREDLKEARRFLLVHWTGSPKALGSLWEADHIVPVVEGGGGCDLDGYRTLCRRCHKAETAALARRRALQRQGAKSAEQLTADAKRLAAWTGDSA